MAWPKPTSRSSGGRSAVGTSSGTPAWWASITAGGVVGGGGARGACDCHREPARLGSAQREEPGAALVDMRPAADPRLAHQRQDQRRVARARRGAGVLHAAAGQLVAQRPQQEIGVGCSHDGRVPSTVVLLHGFTQTGASWGRVAAMLPERYRPLAPDIRGHGERRRMSSR